MLRKTNFHDLPRLEIKDAISFAESERGEKLVLEALLIRALETVLLDLFGRGRLHGTIHTCVGQEFTGVLVGANLQGTDFVTSNHRCHGHFVGTTKNWRGLIDEIVGNSQGVCAGIGSSQHLCEKNFISNGQQGGLLPVGAGIAFDRKRRGCGGIVVSFIGEGTVGEGIFYETMNLDSLWNLPHLIVCENNFYSQSTPQDASVAGTLGARATAFGVEFRETHTWNPAELESEIRAALAYIRANSRPFFLVVKTYRLNAHSKGDDFRDPLEIAYFRERDPLNIILKEKGALAEKFVAMIAEVEDYAKQAFVKPKLSPKSYLSDQLLRGESRHWAQYQTSQPDTRIASQLNRFYSEFLHSDDRAYFLGEDVSDPYGGAFKIASGLQSSLPDQVITTPISEAAITGVGIGLAITGNRPLVEIMFGDFMALAFDQILNNASKFFHMYNRKISCPVIVRSPMGGRRGYGPTHSQSLERFFVGIDNCSTICINSLIDVRDQLAGLLSLTGPAIVLESKVDYALHPIRPPPGFTLELGDAEFPTIGMRPKDTEPDVSIVSYGSMARLVADNVLEIFDACDLIPELIVPISIHPLDIGPICQSVERTGHLIVVEEGPTCGGVGSEVVAQVTERLGAAIRVLRIGAYPIPIPSVPELEGLVLPSVGRICEAIRSFQKGAIHGGLD